jgi:hypothetical protein
MHILIEFYDAEFKTFIPVFIRLPRASLCTLGRNQDLIHDPDPPRRGTGEMSVEQDIAL